MYYDRARKHAVHRTVKIDRSFKGLANQNKCKKEARQFLQKKIPRQCAKTTYNVYIKYIAVVTLTAHGVLLMNHVPLAAFYSFCCKPTLVEGLMKDNTQGKKNNKLCKIDVTLIT